MNYLHIAFPLNELTAANDWPEIARWIEYGKFRSWSKFKRNQTLLKTNNVPLDTTAKELNVNSIPPLPFNNELTAANVWSETERIQKFQTSKKV